MTGTDIADSLQQSPAIRDAVARYRDLAGHVPAVTRFAPSPTGELHVGHVAHMLWVWAIARAVDATIIVRMEDHDRTRSDPVFEQAILHDMDWLGFEADRVSRGSLDTQPSPYRQSDTPEIYSEAFARLAAVTPVYGCTCTRGDLEPADDGGERRYPGTCRGQPVNRPERHVLRAEIPDGDAGFDDLRLGAQRQHPFRTQGDPMIRDALGQWSYQFCVVVDDFRQGVNLVVRGEDLLGSTGRQLQLAALLGRTASLWTLHHPLLHSPDGRKLSKRDRSETVRAMRDGGLTAEEICMMAAERGGFDRVVHPAHQVGRDPAPPG